METHSEDSKKDCEHLKKLDYIELHGNPYRITHIEPLEEGKHGANTYKLTATNIKDGSTYEHKYNHKEKIHCPAADTKKWKLLEVLDGSKLWLEDWEGNTRDDLKLTDIHCKNVRDALEHLYHAKKGITVEVDTVLSHDYITEVKESH